MYIFYLKYILINSEQNARKPTKRRYLSITKYDITSLLFVWYNEIMNTLFTN